MPAPFPNLRSRVTTHGRNAGARSLWRATGMTDDDFGKPIVAIANSYTQFVPGHVHLKDLGDLVASAIREAGGVPREFPTIAIDDGIAMGHGGMLYSLPSRELIRRRRRVHGQRPRRRRAGVYLELRQDHPGDAQRRDAAQHPDRLRLAAIDAISRRVPCLSKVAPNSDYHMEDVHRAGGIPAILGELWRAGLLNTGVHTVHSPSLEAWLAEWDIRAQRPSGTAVELYHAAPGGVRTTQAFSTQNRWSSLDTDAAGGCIRDVEHAYTKEGGLAVLRGNIAPTAR